METVLTRRLAALVLAVVFGMPGPSAARVASHRLFTITDSRIGEASGIAVGRTSPGILYVHNDSGDRNRFFALDARSGDTAATITVAGARNIDWEDIAAAPDRDGTPSVWLADIGDNDSGRDEVQVYRVAEPAVAATDRGGVLRTDRADVWRIRYPDGAADAESFAVAPDGTGYLVTKSVTGNSTVYRLPPRPDADHVQVLQRVGGIRFGPTDTPGPHEVLGDLTATSAAISADGSLLAVRTYTDAYTWRLHDADVRAALTGAPTRTALPGQPQGEGIAIDGTRLLVDSEGVGADVYAVPLPTSAASRTAGGPSTGPVPASSAVPAAPGHPAGTGSPGWLVGGEIAAAVALGAIGVIGSSRRRSRRRRRSTIRAG